MITQAREIVKENLTIVLYPITMVVVVLLLCYCFYTRYLPRAFGCGDG